MPTLEASPAEAVERITGVLKSAVKPLTFGQLKKATRLADSELKSALEAAMTQGAAFRWPDYRKTQYFWRQSADDAARQAVLAIASEEALSSAVLIARACKQVPGFSRNAMQRTVAALISGNELQRVPGLRAGTLMVRPGDSAAYAAAARKYLAERFRRAGFDPAGLTVPLPVGDSKQAVEVAAEVPADAASRILETIQSLEPDPGVPVSTQRLRNHLPGLSKAAFDSAALELRNTEKVFLSLHHDPHNLPQNERDLLIDGGDGTFYVAISLRR
ncbi:MAG TPA: hypothetical protein VMH81_26095 [Bryobacteraceae bacterium]|nr:hypothetical protein [Bryobacteraceae bacterium]